MRSTDLVSQPGWWSVVVTERMNVATGILSLWASDPERTTSHSAELEAQFRKGRVSVDAPLRDPRPLVDACG